MIIKKLTQKRHQDKQGGQALVEFSLTAVVFLFLLVMIFEVGHIMFAYASLQHATRVAARYAVTGQSEAKYSNDPDAGWVSGSSDPLESILPCEAVTWSADSLTEDEQDYWDNRLGNDPQLSRNARVCSIEEIALTAGGVSALPFTPGAIFANDPNSYAVRVSAFEDGEAVSGFAGRPNQYVIVEISYMKPINPFLNWAAPAIQLNGRTVMRNEPFGEPGSTGQGTIPELGEIPAPPESPEPGDLSLAMSVPGSILVTDTTPVTETSLPIELTLHRDNKPITATGSYYVNVYAHSCLIASADLPGSFTPIHTETFAAGSVPENKTFSFDYSFSSAQYDNDQMYEALEVNKSHICLTAKLDPNGALEGQPTANDDTFDAPEIVNLIKKADLGILKETDPTDLSTVAGNDIIDYVIIVTNTNPYGITLNDVEVVDTLDSQMSLVDANAITCSPGCGTIDTSDPTMIIIPIPSLAPGGANEVTITYQGQASATVSGSVVNTASVKLDKFLTDIDEFGGLNTSSVILGTGETADLTIAVSETDNAEKAYAGSTKQFTVIVTNVLTEGPNPASVIVDFADTGVPNYGVDGNSSLITAISWDCTAGACPAVTSGTGATDAFDMVTGETVTFIVTVTTSPAAVGNLIYGASFTVDETNLINISDPLYNTATVALYRQIDPELVSVTDGRSSVNAGDGLTYDIVIRNNGPSPSNGPGANKGIRITGIFTTGYSNIAEVYTARSCNSSGGATCEASVVSTSDGFTLDVYELDVGETVQVSIFIQTEISAIDDIILTVETAPAPLEDADEIDPGNDNDSIPTANDATIDNRHDITNVPPPAPFFINFGDASGCASIQYDDGTVGSTPDPTWIINQAYASGGWGYVDDNNPSNITLHDGTNPASSDAEKLFGCYLQTRSGNPMAVQFDDLFVRGGWKIYFAFSDPDNKSTYEARFFSVVATSGSDTSIPLLPSTFNIDTFGSGAPFILECQLTIGASNDLTIDFTSIGGNALISGMGFEYISSADGSNSCPATP